MALDPLATFVTSSGYAFRPDAALGMDIDIDGPTVLQPIVLNGSGGFCSANHPEQNTNVLRCNGRPATRRRCVPINTVPTGTPLNTRAVPKFDSPIIG